MTPDFPTNPIVKPANIVDGQTILGAHVDPLWDEVIAIATMVLGHDSDISNILLSLGNLSSSDISDFGIAAQAVVDATSLSGLAVANADISLGGFKFINAGAATANGQFVRFEEAVRVSGSQTVTGFKTFDLAVGFANMTFAGNLGLNVGSRNRIYTGGGGHTVTVNTIPTNVEWYLFNAGTGSFTVVAGAGDTLNGLTAPAGIVVPPGWGILIYGQSASASHGRLDPPDAETVNVKVTPAVPVDGDFTFPPPDGALAIDGLTGDLYRRFGGVWGLA